MPKSKMQTQSGSDDLVLFGHMQIPAFGTHEVQKHEELISAPGPKVFLKLDTFANDTTAALAYMATAPWSRIALEAAAAS